MKRFITIMATTAGLALVTAAPLAAQEMSKLTVATGLADATNSGMFKAIKDAVPNLVTEKNVNSGNDGLAAVLANEADCAVAQLDVVAFLAKSEPNVTKLRELVELNPNHLHIIVAKRGLRTKDGYGAFGKTVGTEYTPITNIMDLKGKTVIAAGSAQVTMRLISEKLGLGLTVLDDDSKERKGLGAVENGDYAAFIAMGGKPVKWVGGLDGQKFSLLQMPKEAIAMLGEPYFAQTLSYKNLGLQGFSTVSVNNGQFCRNYQGGKARSLVALRQAYLDNFVDIKETQGTHPAWQEVVDLTATSWQRFEAPGEVAPVAATPVSTTTAPVASGKGKK